MQELVKKIEADAAARLPLPPGRQATEELTRYKGFLKLETHRLKMAHRAGAGGLQICHARAAVLDEMLRHLWNAAKATLSEQAQREFPALALVAIGGYGRAELNPHSDIDFMFLHDRQVAVRKPLPHLSKLGSNHRRLHQGGQYRHAVQNIADRVASCGGRR
jgi:[protein-PII] uridylyltransferase